MIRLAGEKLNSSVPSAAASPSLKAALTACETFTGKDEYCMEYITYIRSEAQ